MGCHPAHPYDRLRSMVHHAMLLGLQTGVVGDSRSKPQPWLSLCQSSTSSLCENITGTPQPLWAGRQMKDAHNVAKVQAPGWCQASPGQCP